MFRVCDLSAGNRCVPKFTSPFHLEVLWPNKSGCCEVNIASVVSTEAIMVSPPGHIGTTCLEGECKEPS